MTTQKPKGRRAAFVTVFGVVALFIGGFVVLFEASGGKLPGADDAYEVSFVTDDVKNLQQGGEVRIAGVNVGTVRTTDFEGDGARVTLELQGDVAPLHEGVTMRVGMKSLVGQSYVDVVDGDGEEIPDGGTLSESSVIPAVDVDELLSTFDRPTRARLESLVASLGPSTIGTRESVSALMRGLGAIGREGATATSAIAAQNEDLRRLVQEANTLLAALDSNRGRIVSLVENTSDLTQATASQREALEASVRGLPGLMHEARTATGALGDLSTDLRPVARDLRQAAPDLSAALLQLPETTAHLRGLLPALDATLTRAPATLTRVPTLGEDVRNLVPGLSSVVADANPMLSYLQPYALDIGSFFGNFGATFDRPVENGVRPVSLQPIFNEYSLRGNPLNLQTLNPLHWNNPYPAPGQAGDPAPFRGEYPRVERAE